MKQIPLLLAVIFLTGCAVPTTQLLTEARDCVDQAAITNSVQSDSGIVVDATKEQRQVCWAPVNVRQDAIEKREKRRAIDRQCCMYNGTRMPRCYCVTPEEFETILRRAQY